jgi:hypothetical protein
VNPALLLEPQQRGIHRTLIQLEYVFAHLLDAARDPEAVQGAKSLQGFQDHKIERALEDFRPVDF